MNQHTLIVVATEPEAARLRGLRGARVVVSGIGAVNAGLAALQAALAEGPRLLLSAGIAGAIPGSGLALGDVVVGSQAIAASLGAEDGEDGFLGLEALGFPLWEGVNGPLYDRIPAWTGAATFAGAAGARLGPIVTVETATGSARSLSRLATRYPDALAEGMEGSGVAQAALRLGLPFLELRGISNLVGPRDRSAWRIGDALTALERALRAGWSILESWHADENPPPA